jgi:transposase
MGTNVAGGEARVALPAPKRRVYRSHSLEEKRRIVLECLTSGESVSIVARRHDLNTNQVFHWRKLHERGKLGEALLPNAPPKLLAVRIEEPTGREPKVVTPPPPPPPPQSWIEIECTHPYRVRVHGAVDAPALARVLEVLAGR